MSTVESSRRGAADALRTAVGVGGIVALVVGILLFLSPSWGVLVLWWLLGCLAGRAGPGAAGARGDLEAVTALSRSTR